MKKKSKHMLLDWSLGRSLNALRLATNKSIRLTVPVGLAPRLNPIQIDAFKSISSRNGNCYSLLLGNCVHNGSSIFMRLHDVTCVSEK